MTTLLRNTTLHFSRRSTEGYEPLDQRNAKTAEDGRWRRAISRRKSNGNNRMMRSVSYKRDRARKRQIFLQTYKLASVSSSRTASSRQKLKKAVIKVKSAVVSILSFMRGSSLRSCNSKSAIEASSPRIVRRCF
ncbi:hypothetical protein RJ640_015714 [Escallonia rubra]|uniref:Uncharacterized protein n=1 Tax=Escallonia rubra TaxID=112253 RepID=A0AA88SKR0_9ASTE|nr:hypothetical protein RJ640_015714 [Escallonia rubra]